ncbi:virulence-associated E family protein [Prochlorococcus sp. AH-736-K21]|nr:VapE domain-containing protein [Prochlorococcus sp. AH-736-K21]MDA9707669.1 virulence-associated E family protein [Prochlorococcus sp. AH-736-K21]
MTNDLVKIAKDFPEGFIEITDDNGEKKILKQKLDSGDLAGYISEYFGNRFRYNLLELKLEFDRKPIEVGIERLLYVQLSQLGWSVGKETAMNSLLYVAKQNSFHPIVEFLENIERDKNIEPVDINKISTDYLGTNNPLYDQMMKVTLVGMMARVLNRGCKFDTCLTLKGEQGIGKSSFWRILAGHDWFCDTWQTTEKDLLLIIQTCWLFEIAELDGMTNKKDAAQIKSLLSSSKDNFRRPYEAAPDAHPRPSIFVGTCNRADFLTDSTGSRRFQIIDLEDKFIDLVKLEKDRLKILKGALIAYRNGEKTYLDTEYQLESDLHNLDYQQENPFMSAFEKWLSKERKVDNLGEFVDISKGFTAKDIIVWSKCRDESKVNTADCRMAANCLRLLGYEQRKQRDKNQTVRKWIKK